MKTELIQQRDTINMISQEAETSRREANTLRLENTQLRAEVARLNGFQPQGDQRVNGASHMDGFNAPLHNYVSGGSRVKDVQAINKGTELPPIRGSFMSEDNMTGVQYNEAPVMQLTSQQSHIHRPQPNPQVDQRRPNGFGYQNEQPRVNGYPSQNEQPHNGFQSQTQQPRVNGFQ